MEKFDKATEFYHPANADRTGHPRPAVYNVAKMAHDAGILIHISGLPFGGDYSGQLETETDTKDT